METLKWLRIDVTGQEGYEPPFFIGSMLRGALGMALKRVVCINPSFRCEGCFAAKECLYHDWYEKKNSYHPYRITSELGMKRLQFSVWLYEEAVSQLPYVLSAIRHALEVTGLGRERRKVPIERMRIGERTVYEKGEFSSLEGIEAREFLPETLEGDWRVEWRLPLRIKEGNRFARDSDGVKLTTLIASIHRRYHQIKGTQAPRLDYRLKGEAEGKWRYLDLYRYSNRQRSRMKLGGLMGSLRVEGLDKESSRYLQLGEILGVGKQTVFGLGDYRLVPINGKEGK